MFAGLFGELFAQAPLHCAAAQVLRRLDGFFAVLADVVFVLLADFDVSLVVFLIRTWWWICLGAFVDMGLLAMWSSLSSSLEIASCCSVSPWSRMSLVPCSVWVVHRLLRMNPE